MNSIFFSFVIPHKNSPDLLQRCLDSIPKREDIEIIIIDDDSDCAIVDFDFFPGLFDNRVKVFFTKEAKGAGYARNIGLKEAKGKWLLFADADDYYHDTVNLLLDQYKFRTDLDLVYFNATTDSPEFKRTASLNNYFRNYFNGDTKSLNDIKYNFLAPWNKIFLRDYIFKNNFCFQEIPSGNDARFVLFAGDNTVKVEVINTVAYVHAKNTKGITYSKRTIEQEIDAAKLKIHVLKFLKERRINNVLYKSIMGFTKIKNLIINHGLNNTFKYLKSCIQFIVDKKYKF